MATFFQPEIILADEPTTALSWCKRILLLLLDLQEQMKNTIVFVSTIWACISADPQDADHMPPRRSRY